MNQMEFEHESDESFDAWNSDVKRVCTPRAEWQFAVKGAAAGADATGRAGGALKEYVELPTVQKAGLLRAEVAGIRLCAPLRIPEDPLTSDA